MNKIRNIKIQLKIKNNKLTNYYWIKQKQWVSKMRL